MTASSSYSGTVDSLWSRDDIRVHTFGGSPKAVEVPSLRDSGAEPIPTNRIGMTISTKSQQLDPSGLVTRRNCRAGAAQRHSAFSCQRGRFVLLCRSSFVGDPGNDFSVRNPLIRAAVTVAVIGHGGHGTFRDGPSFGWHTFVVTSFVGSFGYPGDSS